MGFKVPGTKPIYQSSMFCLFIIILYQGNAVIFSDCDESDLQSQPSLVVAKLKRITSETTG